MSSPELSKEKWMDSFFLYVYIEWLNLLSLELEPS